MQSVPNSTASCLPGPQLRVVESHMSSVSEEMWSRGSMYDKQVVQVLGPVVSVPPVDRLEAQFLYDYGGVVVYDSKASISTDPLPISPTPNLPIDPKKKSLDLSPEPDKKKYLSLPPYPPSPSFTPSFQLTVPPDSLLFESRFESGNLRRVIRRQETEYLLFLQEDTESKGHTQWYYFSVYSRNAGVYRFEIGNLYKTKSLYREGMLPAVRSEKSGGGWQRGGFDVEYKENDLHIPNHTKAYSLTFSYEFTHEDDTVYFAHAVPYTYSDLSTWLNHIQSHHSHIARVDPLCPTLAGNTCEMMTITQNLPTYKSYLAEHTEWNMTSSGRKLLRSRPDIPPQHSKKKGIVLTSRVHPGEIAGSYLLKGAVEFLLSDAPEAVFLRTHCVIKVIPMLNPDGVRYGNSRCSLLGVDLNRRWRNPNKHMHPTIYHTKRMMQVFSEQHEIALFCDFHGHSYQRNAFLYGCSQSFFQLSDRKANIISKMIPLLLNERNTNLAWNQCSFSHDRTKESTARLVVYNEFRVINSYTLEASFYANSESNSQFSIEDYGNIGKDLMVVSTCLVTKTGFYRSLMRVRDLLKRLEVTQLLEKSKSVNVIRAEKPSPGKREGGTPARLSLGQSEARTGEAGTTALAEKQLWETVLAYDDKIKVNTECEDSDSSGSETEMEVPRRVLTPIKSLRKVQSKAGDPKANFSRSPGYIRPISHRVGPLITPPKIYRSERSPVLSNSRNPLLSHQNRENKGNIRTEGQISSSSSTTLVNCCFEPLVLTTDPGIRSVVTLSRLQKPQSRTGSLGRTRTVDPTGTVRASSKLQCYYVDPGEMRVRKALERRKTLVRERIIG